MGSKWKEVKDENKLDNNVPIEAQFKFKQIEEDFKNIPHAIYGIRLTIKKKLYKLNLKWQNITSLNYLIGVGPCRYQGNYTVNMTIK